MTLSLLGFFVKCENFSYCAWWSSQVTTISLQSTYTYVLYIYIHVESCSRVWSEKNEFNHIIRQHCSIISLIISFSHVLMKLMRKWEILIKMSEFLMMSFEIILKISWESEKFWHSNDNFLLSHEIMRTWEKGWWGYISGDLP